MSLDLEIADVACESWLSELYAREAPDSILLAEYPSSNSEETRFKNETRFIIHDPFPPPRPELLKCLGPHHLMFGWGRATPVCSQQPPPPSLVQHWEALLGRDACPHWQDFDSLKSDQDFIVLFPHQSLPADQQLIDPVVNYRLHSKEVIEKINCPQAEVFTQPQYPCIAKLSHGYAGLGNFHLANEKEFLELKQTLDSRWPGATLVFNSIIEGICADYGIQFFLRADGTPCWLGFTEQKFDEQGRWSGGWFSGSQQGEVAQQCRDTIIATADHLHQQGYFGVVGIDLLKNQRDEWFLVDVNPRLTGITPFLVASLRFQARGIDSGIYRASCLYPGSLAKLLKHVQEFSDAKVAVLSAYDDQDNGTTTCHLSVSAADHPTCQRIFDQLLKSP